MTWRVHYTNHLLHFSRLNFTISSKSYPLPILGLFGLHDLEPVSNLDVGRARGTVDVTQGLHLETHRNTRFPGTGSVHVEGFLEDRGLRRGRRILRCRCSESGYHEECADYREFEHFDGSSGQRGKHQIELITPIPRNFSSLLRLFLAVNLAISTSFFSHVNAQTSTAIVSTLPERITIAAFYPRRERGPRTFLKF